MKVELSDTGVESIAGVLYTTYVGPYLVCWSLVLAVGLIAPPDPKVPLVSPALRGTLLYLSALAGLLFLAPVDLSTPAGAWSRLLVWSAGVALPASLVVHRLRREGWSRGAVLLHLLGDGALVLGLGVGLGMALELSSPSLALPLALGGAVFSAGVWAAGQAAPARSSGRVFLAMAVPALAAVIGTGLHLASPAIGEILVTGITDLDREGNRVTIQVEVPALAIPSLVEVDLGLGTSKEFSRRVSNLRYVGGLRAELLRSRFGLVTGSSEGSRLCSEDPTDLSRRRCGPTLPDGGPFGMIRHPWEQSLLLFRPDRLEVRDLARDRRWTFREEQGQIRWPCFAEGNRVLWRVEVAPPPYRQMAAELQPASQASPLAPGHEIQCLSAGTRLAANRFVRGSRREGRRSRLEGPGLSGGGVDLGTDVLVARWSTDGEALALLRDGGRMEVFRVGRGLVEAVELGPTQPPVLDSTAGRFAHVVEPAQGSLELVVRELPSGRVIGRLPTQNPIFDWDREDRILFLHDWALKYFDPDTGESGVLYPPPP
ncbi:MAG: hypothetical protein VX498_13825 [Myxococcota bacterium]|nr:hypothetical protein [Myxococcota bacterium]